jgi:hypothetical protein
MSRTVSVLAPRAILVALVVLGFTHSQELLARTYHGVVISGSPPTTVTAGTNYSFTPTITPPSTSARFTISNKPAWAAFDSTTGRLSGTPTQQATYGNIKIAVSEQRSYAWLPPFTITVTAGTVQTSPPTIAGSPATSVNEGSAYSFTPTASDPNNYPLTFSVQNPPSWASFSTSKGTLSGTPADANVGTYSNIVISVSDGQSSASLAPFSVTVNQVAANGSATVNWQPPTVNTDGTAITSLSGYQISYGTSATSLANSIAVTNPGTASYVVTNLSPGTWYFTVVAQSSDGTQSAPTNVVSAIIN